MTVEMGPRDERPGILGTVAGLPLVVYTRILSRDDDNPHISYNPRRATISLSGESEYSGDEFVRARAVTSILTFNIMLAITPLMFLMSVPTSNGLLGWLHVTAVAVAAAVTWVIGTGSASLIQKVDVIDHTTEPAPDAVDDLKQRYIDGEIDDAELEREAAGVWADE